MLKGAVFGHSVAVVLIAASVAASAAPALPEMTEKAVDRYLVPRFEKFGKATAKLAADLEAACSGKQKRLSAVREDFNRTVLAWAEVEFLRFGPMSVTGRPERISFWPDPRMVMQRQLRTLIARRDPTALDPAGLAEKSAAVQGLPALEALLGDVKQPITTGDEEGRYRCRLAVAVAQNLASIARDVVSEWGGEQGWRRRMREPGPENASYKTQAEPPAEFARALVTGLQMIQDRQVAPLMAASASPGKPLTLPFAPSGLSARYVAAEIGSLKALYETMGLGRDVPKNKAWMPRWIPMAFERLAHDAPAAIENATNGKNDPDRERELRMLRFHVEGIRKLVGRELAPLAGLTIGFNELDGD